MPSAAQLARLAIQAGASLGLYAPALVLVTVLQSSHDTAVTAARQPLVIAAERLRSEREHTTAELQRAARALCDAGARYDRVKQASTALEAALDRLAAGVERATGSAARLPASLPMPPAPQALTITAPAPATHATTGASGR